MTTTYRLGIALAAALVALSFVAGAKDAPATAAKNIVLVHGALTDGSTWRGVYDILTKDGFRVRVVQQPLTGLADDVAATKRVIDQLDGPVVLVGHSYGGTIITVAGGDPKVKALVYVAALQPDVGETTNQLASSKPGKVPSSDLMASPDGFVFLDPARFPADVAADVPSAEARYLAQAQMPVAAAAFDVPVKSSRLARQVQLWGHRDGRSRTQPGACTLDVRAFGHQSDRNKRQPSRVCLSTSRRRARY
jgi:pimeloyl-ACP methyl ester carboxylesterase